MQEQGADVRQGSPILPLPASPAVLTDGDRLQAQRHAVSAEHTVEEVDLMAGKAGHTVLAHRGAASAVDLLMFDLDVA
jgi:hypothetical protein